MLKRWIGITLIPLALHATSVQTLLEALDHQPQDRLERLDVRMQALESQASGDALQPKLSAFAGYEAYTSPNGLVPVEPNRLIKMVKNQHIGQPFSDRIWREGLRLQWPVFVKSLYTLRQKAERLYLASKARRRIAKLNDQAKLVGALAQLRYLDALSRALELKKRSIGQTAKTTRINVQTGRAPQSALLLLQTRIDDLRMSQEEIQRRQNAIVATIRTLTGITLHRPVPLHRKGAIRRGELFALRPLRQTLRATQKAWQAAKEGYWPSLVAQGDYTLSQADAYNNGKSVHEHFGKIGIYLNVPVYDASLSTHVQKAKIAYLKNRAKLSQTMRELQTQAHRIDRDIASLKRSQTLARRNVAARQKLLRIAKVAYKQGTMSEEEYLRYEDALAQAKADLYRIEALYWQATAKLAVLYGNDLKEIVR